MASSREIIVNAGYVLKGRGFELLEKAHIVVMRDRIVAVERGWVSRPDYHFPKGIVLPGLVNAHIHTGDYSFQEAGLDLGFEEIVGSPNSLKHRLLKTLPKQKIINGIRSVLEYSIRIGVLVLADFRENGLEGVELGLEASKGLPVHYLVFARPSGEEDPRRLLEHAYGIGLPTPLSFSEEYLKQIREIIQSKRIATHVGELAEYAEREFELAVKVLDADFIIHGTHLKRRHIEELVEKNKGIVLCPRANSWFAVGIPPIDTVLEYGLKTGLGTDNAGWIKPDLWRELEYTWNILRLRRFKVDPVKLLGMVTYEAASLLGLENYGVVEEGYEASFIVLDSESMGFKFSHNPLASVIKRSGGEHVLAVFFKGDLVYSSSTRPLSVF